MIYCNKKRPRKYSFPAITQLHQIADYTLHSLGIQSLWLSIECIDERYFFLIVFTIYVKIDDSGSIRKIQLLHYWTYDVAKQTEPFHFTLQIIKCEQLLRVAAQSDHHGRQRIVVSLQHIGVFRLTQILVGRGENALDNIERGRTKTTQLPINQAYVGDVFGLSLKKIIKQLHDKQFVQKYSPRLCSDKAYYLSNNRHVQ